MTLHIPFLAIAACIAPAFAGEGWLTDLDAGKTQAATENKAVLVEFTGSDWCPPCKALRKDVLLTPAFKEYAAKDFVLVELDFPNSKPQSPEEKQKNDAWAKQYGVNGFPTILVMDPAGNVYGGFVGGRPNLEAVKEPLDQALTAMKEVKAATEAAAKLTGDDKIKTLAKAYTSIPEEYRRHHASLRQQIIDLDKNDISGIVAAEKKAEELKALNERIMKDMSSCKTPQEALVKIDSYLGQTNLPNETRLQLMQGKLNALLSSATDDESFNKAVSFLDEIAKADTEHGADIERFKTAIMENKAKILERNNQRKAAPQN